MVKAADETAALAMAPANVRSKAKATKLMKMTPAQLEAAHKGHMQSHSEDATTARRATAGPSSSS